MHSPGTVPAEATLMPSGRRLHPILLSTPGALDSLSRCSRGRARVIWANWLASFRPRNSRLLGSSAGLYQNIFKLLNSYSCPPGSWIGELKKKTLIKVFLQIAVLFQPTGISSISSDEGTFSPFITNLNYLLHALTSYTLPPPHPHTHTQTHPHPHTHTLTNTHP